ncbi:MAG: primosomal protein N', partial [Firmicutes bacterium]|nr:primosomal protein N' [Bacillota bacterium]
LNTQEALYALPLPEDTVLTKKQQALYDAAAAAPGISREALLAAGFSAPMLRTLIKQGCIEQRREKVEPNRPAPALSAADLSPAQQQVYDGIIAEWQGRRRPYLLHGVTGSGKTEVYLRLLAEAAARGKQGIVLAPEIALSAQLQQMLQRRLQLRVVVLHSALTAAERRRVWQDIAAGEVDVVIGARSAVFAPLPDLGIIIIDEEQESSYKQDNVPRFHAREAAIERCRLAEAQLVLGSATPSVTSYHAAETGSFAYGELKERYYNAPPQEVDVVDMRRELREGNRSIFSRLLQDELIAAFTRGEQSMLLLNRRGYFSFYSCRDCGSAILCPHCAVAMAYHAAGGQLKCHCCGHTTPLPPACPGCGSLRIRHFGAGTQKVEEEVRRLLPEARVARLDSDVMEKRGAHEQIVRQMREGKIDVLVGTQMIAKGFDFPRVTLAAVVAADTLLNLPDHLAAERTFQLLTQLCGCAGRRDLSSRAIIQTYQPQALPIVAAAAGDYRLFYRHELRQRQMYAYPPFAHLLRIVLSAENLPALQLAAQAVADQIEVQLLPGMELLGPAPAVWEKMKDRWRWQILLRGDEPQSLLAAAERGWQQAQAEEHLPAGLQVQFDVDPYSMF